MTLLLLMIVFVALFLIGSAPVWPHAKQWGYWPSGVLGVLLVALVVLLLTGLA